MRTHGTWTRVVVMVAALALALGVGACKSDSTTAASAPTSTTAAAAAGPNGEDAAFSCPTENTKAFAKTTFAAHAGLGFGAFHHWIYAPMKDGDFAKGHNGRVAAFVKAGLAGLYTKRQVRLTAESAEANPRLCKSIVAPLHDLSDKISGAVDAAKKGDFSGIDKVNTDAQSVMTASNKQGDTITPDDNADITEMPS